MTSLGTWEFKGLAFNPEVADVAIGGDGAMRRGSFAELTMLLLTTGPWHVPHSMPGNQLTILSDLCMSLTFSGKPNQALTALCASL